VLHQIGAGTLGPVFRAYDARRERLVAVKLFKLDLPPERVHQLVAEFEKLIAADLNHPAVAVPLATGITGVSAYLAQDYVAAESLDLAVREYGAAPPPDALRVAVQLAAALDLAAVAGVHHGALHPRDVLLSDDETRVTGLGVARALESIGVPAPVRRPYTAPERRSPGGWGAQADVFSLAALVYELLWGRRPPSESEEVADSLTELPGSGLRSLQFAFARALAEAPEDRFDSALEFAEALKAAFPDIQLVEPAPPKKRSAAPRKKEAAPTLPLATVESAAQESNTDPEPIAALESSTAPEAVEPFDPLTPVEPQAPFELREPLEPRALSEPPEPLEPSEPPSPPYPSVLDQTRSAVWPLMAALAIGLAIGFAGGYGVGTTREHPVAALTPAESIPPAQASAQVPSREATEVPVASAAPGPANSVPVAPAPAAPLQKAPPPKAPATPPAETRTAKAPDRQPTPKPKPPPRAPERTTAAVPAGTTGQLVGRLNVDSRPSGARVYLDNKQIGVTPMAMPSVRAGEHAIRLELGGYRHWTSSVRVVAGEQNRVTASLDR